ncbi:uncharacterized protein RCO7_04033 [Rhynchosporium graminicola]|uniref:SprT-like domain-containing protein n=1 Tax=Rhynchosporium graminicola TaxID=2792576 RepID=A0A1E1LF45_9HELO|nr:uncharacterized protein RCO7_04033 [Rhynchosporium commune]
MSHRQHGHPSSSRKASGKPASKSSGKRKSAKQHSNAHTHPKIEDDLPNPRQHTYFGRDLARTLRYNAEKDIETVLADHEINLLQDPIPEVSSTRESKNLMNTYFLIFDQAFFCKLLGKDLKKRIVIYDDHQNDASLGYYKDGIIHINMTIQDRTGPLGEKQLAVLLHEMLHAFLDLYTCNCSKCEKRTADQGGFGATGHGSTWANSMIYLQKSLARQVGWDVDCGVERGVYTEMNASGWQPRPEQFERWNIKSSHVPQVKKHHERGKHKKRPKGSACVVM